MAWGWTRCLAFIVLVFIGLNLPAAALEFPREMKFEPAWREPADCGPLALYGLMRLKGYNVTLEDVKTRCQLDPQEGCSLENLRQLGEQLGMTAEIRYVNVKDIRNVPPPFILHGVTSIAENIGHFTLVVDYDDKTGNYSWIDTDHQRLSTNPEFVVLDGYTGYVLIGRDRITERLGRWLWYGWLGIAAILLIRWCSRRLRALQDLARARPNGEMTP
jgi:Peptidase C39 family